MRIPFLFVIKLSLYISMFILGTVIHRPMFSAELLETISGNDISTIGNEVITPIQQVRCKGYIKGIFSNHVSS